MGEEGKEDDGNGEYEGFHLRGLFSDFVRP